MLKRVTLLRDRVKDWNRYPFSVPAIRHLEQIDFRSRIVFFVGENGSGKSTMLEAIAEHSGFNREGGSRHMGHSTTERGSASDLVEALRLSWTPKILRGFFLRAESFFNTATLIDEIGSLEPYGGKSLHDQSHGESFLALFENRFFRSGFYLLDEPEAALSPQRQLSLLLILHDLLQGNQSIQFIIATHSPLLLAYPGAQILFFDGDRLSEIAYRETPPYQIYSGFLRDPDLYLRHLFAELPLEEPEGS